MVFKLAHFELCFDHSFCKTESNPRSSRNLPSPPAGLEDSVATSIVQGCERSRAVRFGNLSWSCFLSNVLSLSIAIQSIDGCLTLAIAPFWAIILTFLGFTPRQAG
jgi:hypothetical protein